jgi:hypothetical protein
MNAAACSIVSPASMSAGTLGDDGTVTPVGWVYRVGRWSRDDALGNHLRRIDLTPAKTAPPPRSP